MLLPVSSDCVTTTIKYDINLGMLSTLKIHSISLTRVDGRFSFQVIQLLYRNSQPPGRGLIPGPGINYTGPREVLLEFVILVF